MFGPKLRVNRLEKMLLQSIIESIRKDTPSLRNNNTLFGEELRQHIQAFRKDIGDIMQAWKFVSLIFLIGVIGNGLVIAYFLWKNKGSMRKMSSYHFLITILAAVDLLTCITGMGFYFHVVFVSFASTLRSFSIWMLVIISYDRFRSIVYPFKSKWTKKRFLAIISIIFLAFLIFDLAYGTEELLQFISTSYEKFNTRIFIKFLLIEIISPILLMYGFYRKISTKIQTDMLKSITQVNSNIHLNRKAKALRVLRLLIAVFIVFIVPGRIYMMVLMVLLPHGNISTSTTLIWYQLGMITMFSSFLNNTVNVLVYAYIMKDFRRFLINIFTCKMFRKNNLRQNNK